MRDWKLFFFVFSVECVVYGQGWSNQKYLSVSKVPKCHYTNLRCVNTLQRTVTKGFPEYGIPSADEVTIPVLTIKHYGITLRNIVVTGFGSQVIDAFNLYPNHKTLFLAISSPVQIRADLTLDSHNPRLSPWYPASGCTGHYVAKAHIFAQTEFNFHVKRSALGVEFFEIGADSTKAGVKGSPEASLEFNDELLEVPGFSEQWHHIAGNIRDDLVIGKIIEKAYSSVMSNFRSITRTLPRSSFFYDM